MALVQLTDPRLLRAQEEKYAKIVSYSISKNTNRIYKEALTIFTGQGYSVPCSTQDIIKYLVDNCEQQSAHALGSFIKAIRFYHKHNNYVDPTDNMRVKDIMKGIVRKYGKPVRKVKPFTFEDMQKLSAYFNNYESHALHAMRNNAMFLVGFFGALRRSELIAIELKNIKINEQGLIIHIPKSKTDQNRKGQDVCLPRLKADICPVAAVEKWLEASKLKKNGYLFPVIVGLAEIDHKKHLDGNNFNQQLKVFVKEAGLEEPHLYSSHSLRRGFATQAAQKGVSIYAIQKHGRWQNIRSVNGYIDVKVGFVDNPTLIFDTL